MFVLRRATKQDQKAIKRLVQIGKINPTGLDWSRFWVAVTPEGTVIGTGQIKPHTDGSRELASITTHPDYRGKGIARSIILQLLKENPSPLYLTCRSTLESFYGQFGFVSIQLPDMPHSFQRIFRLVNYTLRLSRRKYRLLVMKIN
jgi:N-acetylglutamate synthase-like GNAT family acetyltransferase